MNALEKTLVENATSHFGMAMLWTKMPAHNANTQMKAAEAGLSVDNFMSPNDFPSHDCL